MISLFLHTLFVSFIAFVLLSIIQIHERDAGMRRILTLLVLVTGIAAIMNCLLVLYGIDF